MQIREKVRKFIEYCNCVSEFDKFFWLSKLDSFDEPTLLRIYDILLRYENKLVDFELRSIGKINTLIEKTYPELKDQYLPDYQSLFNDFEAIQNEITLDNIKSIRSKLKGYLKR